MLDSLRFVSESLRYSLDHALRDRGGIGDVRRRSAGRPNHFSIRLEFNLPDGSSGQYTFRAGSRPNHGFEVQEEDSGVFHITINPPIRVNAGSFLRDPAYFCRYLELAAATA